jgi:hypothetical protein
MKKLALLIAFVAASLTAHATDETNGFLVFEVSRYVSAGGHSGGSKVKQKFKVPLTEEFLANFKHVPSQSSSGTGFCCSGGNLRSDESSTRFTWWLGKTADNRWSIHMWGEGFEKVSGLSLNSKDPNVTQCLTIKKLDELDMSYNLSYVNKYDSIGISFTAKYVTAKDIDADGPIPSAPVRKADHSILFKGDDQKKYPLEIKCVFQEG